jgi:hypothetical protein
VRPAIVAARIKRADRRPRGWDLDLSLIRDDLAEEDVAALECQFPGLAARLAATPGPGHHFRGVQSPHPVRDMDHSAAGCSLGPARGWGEDLVTGPVVRELLPSSPPHEIAAAVSHAGDLRRLITVSG